MRYNGLNNMFFPLCLINDNHSVTSPSHTKKTKSDNYSKHRCCCQLTDIVYDVVFEVLQWLKFLSAFPPVQ
ncbi:hypothetical protein, partial [Escherichia coli]|uniref:hypothetical protein n=1 Tax=Escherichia coli TaxID=562 RepID=UPI003F8B4496